MLLFADAADPTILKSLNPLIDGATTNPSLLAAVASNNNDKRSAQISALNALQPKPVSLQVIGDNAEEMVKEGKNLAALGKNAVVKLPLTPQGLLACKTLRSLNIPVNITLCHTLQQAWLAAKAHASYISVFMGRLDDHEAPGAAETLLNDVAVMLRSYNFPSLLLAASVRRPDHVRQALRAGAHVATLPPPLINSLAQHPLTDKGLKQFMHDHNSSS